MASNRWSQSTVLGGVPFELAVSLRDRESLFAKLERFVNLGDTAADFTAFACADRRFLPFGYDETPFLARSVSDAGAPRLVPPAVHRLTLDYRTSLRLLWEGAGGPNNPRDCAQLLDYLLGLHGTQNIRARRLFGSKARILLPGSTCIPDWWSGRFLVASAYEFHRAVFLLWRERWRAKKCVYCLRYFVAAKQARRYCSPACSVGAKRQRDLKWWTEHGNQWRRKRSRKAARRPKQNQRKRGK